MLAILAVVLTVVAWAALSVRRIPNETLPTASGASLARVHSIAYTLPEATVDGLFVRKDQPGDQPRRIASFPYALNFHARGRAAPTGDRLAVLSIADLSTAAARLSVVDAVSGELREAAGLYDYTSEIAWSGDGSRIAVVRSKPADGTGRTAATVFEIAAASGAGTPIARFDDVFVVAPVGYAADGQRLFVAVIDSSGSTLWAARAGKLEKVALLSPGRTRDWTLSPGGARMAYIEVLGNGEGGSSGKVVLTATGAITSSGIAGAQLGVAWDPRTGVAQFGGPGGTLQLSSPSATESYVVPLAWSPDGTSLVAAVCNRPAEATASCVQTIEVATAERRLRIADEAGIGFAGWVLNAE
ncbi:MAG: hypothetical protein HY875_00600 [Chloroflexi bacterium]|nr:hypothetical protein [Chloroflexota bacterium]